MNSSWYARFIKSMIADIAQADGISVSDFQGCTKAELHQLMQVQNVQRLPEMYQQFMLQMGKGFATRHDDMLWTFSELLKFDKTSHGLLNDVFVFMWHKDYALIGFAPDGISDNPTIIRYDDSLFDLGKMITTSETLSDFLIDFFAPE
jgi:hypothetical protein